MSDALPPKEDPPKPDLKDLAKPKQDKVVESPSPNSSAQPVTVENSHELLTAIAEGNKEKIQSVPSGESTIPEGHIEQSSSEKTDVNNPKQKAENEPNKEKLDSLLTQSAQVFLDSKDPRAVTVALARASSASTPLGAELRRDVAHMVAEHKGDGLTAEAREQLAKIQEELRLLNLPLTDAARSEFANTLESYAAGHPDRGITPALIEQVRTNVQSRPDGIANLMKADSTLTARLMTELNGDAKESFPSVGTPEGLVKAAGLPMTPENNVNAGELLRPKYTPPTKEPVNIGDMILPTALATSMTLMFIASLAGAGGEQGGH